MPADADPDPLAGGIRARFPDLYAELREIAARMVAGRPAQTLTPSDLLHDAFVKLSAEEARRRTSGASELGDKPDGVFKACFGAACRDVLIERARARRTEKRGGDRDREPLHPSIHLDAGLAFGVLEVDDAIAALDRLDALLAQLAEFRLFGDLTIQECAELLGLSPRTVDRKWAFVRAWLHDQLA